MTRDNEYKLDNQSEIDEAHPKRVQRLQHSIDQRIGERNELERHIEQAKREVDVTADQI